MSNKGSSIVSFLAGALVGAAVALLYAPTSGEELRYQIKSEADVRLEKLSADMDKAIAELQASADKTRADVMAYIDQLHGQEEVVEIEADVEVEEVEEE